MDAFLRLPVERQRLFFQEGQQRIGLAPTSIEKDFWRRDYETMREEMFFDEPPAFDEVMRVIRQFEEEFNNS